MGAGLAEALRQVLGYFFQLVQLLVLASVICSWVGDRNNAIVQMIYNITEPIYRPLRRLTSRIPGPFDLAPIFLLFIIIFLEKFSMSLLYQYAQTGG